MNDYRKKGNGDKKEEKGKEKIRPGELNCKKDVAGSLEERTANIVDLTGEASGRRAKDILEKQGAKPEYVPLGRYIEELKDGLETIFGKNEDIVEENEIPSGEIIIRERYDEMRTVSLDVTEKENVGGIGIRYAGMDANGKGVYEVLINKTVAGKTHVEEKRSEKVEVPDFGFSVTISPLRVKEDDSIVNIEVKIQPKQAEDYVYYVVKKVAHGDGTATYDLAPLSKEDAKKVQELNNDIKNIKSGGNENLVKRLESEKEEILVAGDILKDFHSYTGPANKYENGGLVSKNIEKEEGFREPSGAMTY